MNPRQLCYFKRKLIAWKNDLLDGSNKAREHLVSNSLNEPDVADRASLECDTFYELNNRDRNRKLIAKIDAALQRIEKGEYGYCEETGSEIGVKRLGARLVATLCIEAQEIRERQKKNYSGSDYGA
ncbi:RNA polymerase-binding protein DksA [Candidatus Xenohaliotis californiensis]